MLDKDSKADLATGQDRTSVDNGKARGKVLTRLPVLNLPLCHWSSKFFDLRTPSLTDVPVLLLNQPTALYSQRKVWEMDSVKMYPDVRVLK